MRAENIDVQIFISGKIVQQQQSVQKYNHSRISRNNNTFDTWRIYCNQTCQEKDFSIVINVSKCISIF